MKVAVYSAVFGGYDPDPYDVVRMHTQDVNFYWITDTVHKYKKRVINGWDIVHEPLYVIQDKYKFAKTNRFYKLQPHKVDFLTNYDINVYIDGNKKLFNIDMLLEYCQELYDNPDLDAIFCRHTERDNAGQEAREVAKLRRDDPRKVITQYQEYITEGFPDNIPLIVASIQIRKTHSKPLQDMLDCWWGEVLHKSYRDQISMPYAIWKTNFTRYRTINVWTERLKMIANTSHRKVLHV